MSLTWALASDEDVEGVVALWHRASGIPLEEEGVAVMGAAVDEPRAHLLIGRLGPALVSAVYGILMRGAPDQAQIALLCVDPEQQRRGYGTATMTELTARLADVGVTRCRLNVRRDNTQAQRLYEATGWEYVRDEDDELIYTRAISAP